MREITIENTVIGDDGPGYVIAEIGHNHQGDMEKARQLFDAAKEAGAGAVKLQKRDNKALFTHEMYNSAYENRNSFGPTYGSHREALELNYDQYMELKSYAKELEVCFFATAFDIPSVEFLEKVDVAAYKVASGDVKSTPLLKEIAGTGKPVILSTGGASMEEVVAARDTIMPINENLAILQCTAAYPPEWDKLNLRVIETFRDEFKENVIGLSSHDSGIAMATAAYVFGARIFEKHFTLNRAMKGTDHAFSLEPAGLRKLCRDLDRLYLAMGDGVKRAYECELGAVKKMGKSLVAARDLAAGTRLTESDITMKSPGGHLPPTNMDLILGKELKTAVAEDEAFSTDMVA